MCENFNSFTVVAAVAVVVVVVAICSENEKIIIMGYLCATYLYDMN